MIVLIVSASELILLRFKLKTLCYPDSYDIVSV